MGQPIGERGEGGLKALIFLAVLGYGVFCGIKLVPRISEDGAFSKGIEEVLKFAGPTHARLEEVKQRVNEKIKANEIPIDPEKVEVTDEGSQFRVKLAYTREVKLIFWTYRKEHKINMTGAK